MMVSLISILSLTAQIPWLYISNFQTSHATCTLFGTTVSDAASITSTFQRQFKQSVLPVLLLAFGDGLVDNVSNIRLSSLDKQNSFVMTWLKYCS